MNKLLAFLLSAFAALACQLPAWADTTAARDVGVLAERPISFEAALIHVLRRNPELRQAKLAIDIAEQDERRARSSFLPRLDLTSTTQRIEAYGTIPGLETLLLSGQRSAYHTASGLTLALNVANGGADLAGIMMAAAKKTDIALQEQMRRVAVASAVLDSVHGLRLADVDSRIAAVHAHAKAERLTQIEADFSLGRRPALALSEARYEADSSELDRAMRRRAYLNVRRDLLAMMGEDGSLGAARAVAPAVEPPYSSVLGRFGLDEACKISQVDVAAARVEQARFDVIRARSRYLPRLDVFVSMNYAGLSQTGLVDSFKEQPKDKKFVGFTLTWNLFNGFETDADVKASSLRVAAAQAGHDSARDEQRKREAEFTRPMADAVEDERIQRKKLDLIERKLEISRVKLELGKTDASAHQASETELRLQELELEKRAELIDYYQAMLLLHPADAGWQR